MSKSIHSFHFLSNLKISPLHSVKISSPTELIAIPEGNSELFQTSTGSLGLAGEIETGEG